MSDPDELSEYWGQCTAAHFRSLADAMERYGAADTLQELRDAWLVLGSVMEHDGGPVEAAVQTELAGLSGADGYTWLAPAALTLSRNLDNPEARPYYSELAAELVRALVWLRGGVETPPDYSPRLRLIRGGDESRPEKEGSNSPPPP